MVGDPDVRLAEIFARIRTRSDAVEDAFDSWPCGAGCDHCCRHLHRVPEATAAEWRLFERGIQDLPEDQRASVRQRVADLASTDGEGADKVTCPALDTQTSRCSVYDHRPVACRSYGYYRSRAHDLWCKQIETHVESNAPSDPVVFGNHDSLDAQLHEAFGELIAMTTWFRRDD